MHFVRRGLLLTLVFVCLMVTAPAADPMPCYGDEERCETDYYPFVAWDTGQYSTLTAFMEMTGDPEDTCNEYFGTGQWEDYAVHVGGVCTEDGGWATCTNVYIECWTVLG